MSVTVTTIHPMHIYGEGLQAGGGEDAAISVRMSDGTHAPLALDRFLARADETDEAILADLAGPVLDVGCGPGRHLHALARRGVFGLGVDLSTAAVALAREGGANAIVGSIFGEVPGAGTWRSALLLDGNIGIGGHPVRLLQRVGSLLEDRGAILIELDPPDARSGPLQARLETPLATSLWFDWARVAVADIDTVARAAAFTVLGRWRSGGRWFAVLRKRS